MKNYGRINIIHSFINAGMKSDRDLFILSSLLTNSDKFVGVDWAHSGGGCTHVLLQLKNKKIVIYHGETGDFEISYHPYKSFNEYFADEEKGFGWEYDNPNYESRHLSLKVLDEDIEHEVRMLINKNI